VIEVPLNAAVLFIQGGFFHFLNAAAGILSRSRLSTHAKRQEERGKMCEFATDKSAT
jgi:hypothetical protein